MREGGGVFDFGDDGLGAPKVMDDGLELLHIGGPAHEALGEEIHFVLHAPLDIDMILLGEGIHVDVQADGMDALPSLQEPADDHLGLQQVRAPGEDLHRDGAVVQQPELTGRGPFEQFGMRQGGRPGGSLGDRASWPVEDALASLRQIQRRVQQADAPLGALKIEEHRYGAPQFQGQGPNLQQGLRPGFRIAVTGIQANRIGFFQGFPQAVTLHHGRSQGHHEFGLAHIVPRRLHRHSTHFSTVCACVSKVSRGFPSCHRGATFWVPIRLMEKTKCAKSCEPS